MVPDYIHTAVTEDYSKEDILKVEERILNVEGERLLTFRNVSAKSGISGVVVPGFIVRERYKTKNDIPVSEVRSVKKEEKEKVLEAVEKEYNIPRKQISCWPV